MAIYRLLQNSPLGPEEIAVLTDAYERTLLELQLVDRSDPITDMIAKKVIELGQRGVREAKQPPTIAVEGMPVYALDKHTRLGREAIRALVKSNCRIREYLVQYGDTGPET